MLEEVAVEVKVEQVAQDNMAEVLVDLVVLVVGYQEHLIQVVVVVVQQHILMEPKVAETGVQVL
jgi:hypothetical protein